MFCFHFTDSCKINEKIKMNKLKVFLMVDGICVTTKLMAVMGLEIVYILVDLIQVLTLLKIGISR